MQKNKKKNNGKFSIAITYFIIAIAFIIAINYSRTKITTKDIDYSEFLRLIETKQVSEVIISSSEIRIVPISSNVEYKGKTLITPRLNDDELIEKLHEDGNIKFTGDSSKESQLLGIMLSSVFPVLLIFVMWKFLFSKMGGGGGAGVMGIGKNTAKVYMESDIKVNFDDVAGQEEAKESLREVIDFLNGPQKYTQIGAKLPKGVLLVGPPGTGKTLIAKAVAGEAKVPFFSLSGSSFVEMFVGVGASRVRELFKDAVAKAPCIVFIDEIDAIGKSRDSQMQSNDEREQTLNQLLSEMDGFDSSKGVVLLGATNRPEILDKALLRPGRFDRRVIVDRPDFKGREAILQVHAKNVILGKDVELSEIARSTPGAVGADLANIINEAALRAVRRRRNVVLQEDLREAVEVIVAGKEKKDRILSPREREIVAYHEVGHALVATMLKNTEPVHKITIVPRTMGALGYTMQIEEEEKFLNSREDLINEVTTLVGGRAAEEVVFNLATTGAANDIERATGIARKIISVYGMSEEFDMMALESIQNKYLDGRSVRNCSEETSTLLDKEAVKIIRDAHINAKEIISENRELMDTIANKLLEKEIIFGNEFLDMVYEKYPEMKETKDKEKSENERKVKELEEARAKLHAERDSYLLQYENKNTRPEDKINEAKINERKAIDKIIDDKDLKNNDNKEEKIGDGLEKKETQENK